MRMMQTSGGRVRYLSLAGIAAALVTAGMARGATLDQVYWVGPASDGAQGGNWDAAANWATNKTVGSDHILNHWVPGSNGDGSHDTGGVTDTFQDDGYINNGSDDAYTVTVNTDVSSNTSWRYFQINAGTNYQGAPMPKSAVTLNVETGANLYAGSAHISGQGVDATVNINGGTAYFSGGTTVGDTLVYVQPGSATGRLNVSSGTLYTNNVTAGNQSTGIVSLSGTGVIDTNLSPSGANFYGGLTLGSAAPTTVTVGGTPTSFAGTGTMNQSGGTLEVGRTVKVGGNAAGVYNLSDGIINVHDSGRQFWVGYNAQGTFNVSGGTANLGQLHIASTDNNTANTPTGLMSLTGGSVNASLLRVGNSDNSGTGTLRITGTGGNLTITRDHSPSVLTYANSTLNFQIGADGVSTIFANSPNSTTDSRSVIGLSGTLDLDLLNGFTPQDGDQFVLLSTDVVNTTYGGIVTAPDVTVLFNSTPVFTNTGLFLDPDDVANWTYNVVTTGTAGIDQRNQLVATYIGPVPEPASLSLLAAGGLLALRKRRN